MHILTQFNAPVARNNTLAGVSICQQHDTNTALVATLQVPNPGATGNSENVVTVTSLTYSQQQPQQNQQHRHQPQQLTAQTKCEAKLESNFQAASICSASSSVRSASQRHCWIVVGGTQQSADASTGSAAIWFAPVGGSGRLTGAALAVPTASGDAKRSPITSASFFPSNSTSSSDIIVSTADGFVGIVSVAGGSLASVPLTPVPGISGSKPVAVAPAEDVPSTFFVATSRLVARIDPRQGVATRPAQLWLWHPRDRITSMASDEAEIVCGTDEGAVLLWDARSPTLVAGGGTPWHLAPRPGVAVTGVSRLSSALGGVAVAWSDGAVGAVDVVSCPNIDSKCSYRMLAGPAGSRLSAAAANVSCDASPGASPPNAVVNMPFDNDSSVPGGVFSVLDRSLAENCLGVTATRSGLVSVVGRYF